MLIFNSNHNSKQFCHSVDCTRCDVEFHLFPTATFGMILEANEFLKSSLYFANGMFASWKHWTNSHVYSDEKYPEITCANHSIEVPLNSQNFPTSPFSDSYSNLEEYASILDWNYSQTNCGMTVVGTPGASFYAKTNAHAVYYALSYHKWPGVSLDTKFEALKLWGPEAHIDQPSKYQVDFLRHSLIQPYKFKFF